MLRPTRLAVLAICGLCLACAESHYLCIVYIVPLCTQLAAFSPLFNTTAGFAPPHTCAMQRLRKSLLDSMAAIRLTAQRVGAAGSSKVDAAVAAAPQAASATRLDMSSTRSGSHGSSWARWRSTAVTAAADAPAGSPFQAYTSAPALTRHQVLKRLLKPQNSGRKQFKRNWQKQLQIKVSLLCGGALRRERGRLRLWCSSIGPLLYAVECTTTEAERGGSPQAAA